MSAEERQKHIEWIISCFNKYYKAEETSINYILRKRLVSYDIQERSMRFEAVVPDSAKNEINAAHGAYISGVLDDCMGFCALCFVEQPDQNPTTADMQFNCVARLHPGDKINICAKLRHIGKRSAVVSAEIYRNGQLCAFGSENMAIISKGYFDRETSV